MLIKKLLFAPLVLSLMFTLSYLYKLVLDKHLEVFFGTWGGLQELGLIALVIILVSFSYCLYITFTQNTKYYLGLAILTSLIPFAFLTVSLAIVAFIGFFASFSIVYFGLISSLKSYVNFQPVNLLSSPIKLLNMLLAFSLSLVFYFHSNAIIQTQGFIIPDPILDWAIDLSMQNTNIPVKGEKYLAQIPTLSQDQIDTLKQNPQLLEQFGLNPDDLDQISTSDSPTSPTTSGATNPLPNITGVNLRDIIKDQITQSLDQVVKPYLFVIPMILAFLLYSLISFALWIFSLFLGPIISLVFYIFEKSGFLKFEKEMREVKKIII